MRAGADRALVEPSQRRRIGSRRVLGDVHHLEAFLHRELDRVLGGLEQPFDAPPFGVLADRRRADEHPDFDRQAGALGDLDDRRDVGDGRPGGAVGAHSQLRVDNLPRQALDIADDVRAGAGQADVGGIDAEPSIRCRISIFCAIVGVRTDGDCSPSRSVSSSSMTRFGLAGAPILFQS